MNYLSWLIYFGGVSSSLSTLFGVIAVLGTIVFICAYIFLTIALVESNSDEEKSEIRKLRPPKWYAIVLFVFGIISILLPSSSTVYMIAASQLSEVAIHSPMASDIYTLLHQQIENYLKEEKQQH